MDALISHLTAKNKIHRATDFITEYQEGVQNLFVKQIEWKDRYQDLVRGSISSIILREGVFRIPWVEDNHLDTELCQQMGIYHLPQDSQVEVDGLAEEEINGVAE